MTMEKKYNFLDGYEGFLNRTLTIHKTLKPEFEKLLNDYKAKVESFNEGKLKTEYKEAAFIGAGNPDAEILFIGKEMAIDNNEKDKEKKHENQKQHEATVLNNIEKWHKPELKEIKTNPCPWDDEKYLDEFYSPWFPYFRQNNLIRKDSKEENGIIKSNNGTSRTEYFYQKIISGIYEIPEEEQEFLTLHMYAFQSELSTATARVSAEVNPAERKQSIKNRKCLWKTPFFQDFPITILGIGPNKNYIIPGTDREDVINIVKDFNVKYEGPTHYIGKKFINVHFSKDGKHMLLHTSHLSASSNDLIRAIVNICNEFLKNKDNGTGRGKVISLIRSKNYLK